VDMRDALASIGAVLNGNIEGSSGKDALDHARYALDGQEEILDFGRRQIIEARHEPAWRDEDMTGQQRLEVD
jgi:hypothetical protein